MTISFNSIQNVLLVPGVYVEYDNSKASKGLAPLPNRVLLIGSRRSTGSVAALQLRQILRENDGDTYFGADSQLAWMCKKFKRAAKFTEVWAIALDDEAGASAATKTVTFTGSASSAGAHNFLIHGERVPVGVASGDTAGVQSVALADEIVAKVALLFAATFGWIATFGGTTTDGDYTTTFTGYGLVAPVTVTTPRAAGVPADDSALATQHAADITALIATTLAGVVASATAAGPAVTIQVNGGLESGTITHSAPAPGAITGAYSGITTLMSKHASLFSNDLDVRLNYYPREDLDAPSGTTVAIADGTPGALDPDINDALDVVGDEFFTKIVSGYNGSAQMAATETFLASKWGPMVQKDGLAFFGIEGTFAELATIGDGRNSQFTVLCPPDGTSAPTPPWERAAVTAAVDSSEPDPGRPRQTLPLPGVLPAARGDRFMLDEHELLLEAGISTFKADDGGRLLVERLVTTYTTDANSLPDASYRNVNTMHLLAALRYTTRARFAQKYPRHKLAADGTRYGPGQAVITPSVARGEMLTLFEEWELQAWVQNFQQFSDELVVEINANDPDRLDVLMGPNLIKQFRVMAAQIQFQ